MNKGRYIKHTREEAEYIQKLRGQGLAWRVIQERTGMSMNVLTELVKRLGK